MLIFAKFNTTMAKNISLQGAIRKFNQVLISDKKDVGAIYFFAILSGLVQLSLPLGIQSIISFVLAGRISTSIVVLITMVIFGVFINGLLQVRQQQIIEKIKQKIFFRYSMEYANRIPMLNMEKLDGQYLPELVNRFFESVSLQKGIDKLLLDLPAAVVQIGFGMILLSIYHPVFIAFSILLIFVILVILRLTSVEGLKTAIQASGYKYDLVSWLEEMARTIKSFKYTKGTKLHLHQTDKILNKYLLAKTNHFKILMIQVWGFVWFKIIITATMLIIGVVLLVNQQINVGQFIAADIVIIAMISSIEKLISNLDTIYEALVSVEKLSLIAEAEIEKSGTLVVQDKPAGIKIDFNNVNYAYNENNPVLQNFNTSIEAGKIVVIKGQSGSGKSTILRLLTGAYTNFEGAILIDDIPIQNYDIDSLRKHTGILLGAQEVFNDTLLNNITMGDAAITMEQISALAKMIGLDVFIESLRYGFDTVLHPLGALLANDVRRNILLMRAILGSQRLLLLEHPFAHLHKDQVRHVLAWIKQHNHCTILLAAPDDSLDDYCHQTIQL
jgi:ATP-binding cassette, subfamily B, bacterial